MMLPAGTFTYTAEIHRVRGLNRCRTVGARKPILGGESLATMLLVGYEPELVILNDRLLFLASERRFASARAAALGVHQKLIALLERGDVLLAARGFDGELALALVRGQRLLIGIGHLGLLTPPLQLGLAPRGDGDVVPRLDTPPELLALRVTLGQAEGVVEQGQCIRLGGYDVRLWRGGVAVANPAFPSDFVAAALGSLSLELVDWADQPPVGGSAAALL